VTLACAYADQVAQAITNARLQVHLEQAAAAAERTRLAHELHDTVAQELFAARLIAQSLPQIWETHRAEAEGDLQQLDELTQSAYAGLRALLLELRPATLEQLPLSQTLRQLGAAMSARANQPIAVETDGGADTEPPLPSEVKVACYRVAQEALTNAVKYAKARTINVRLQASDQGGIALEISDDGQGFVPRAAPAGRLGLTIMRERAQAVGADLHVTSQLGQGTHIMVMWPSSRKRTVPDEEGAAAHERANGHSGGDRG
jgi:two-component system nitrate/nitrite sensor histidine kinase NarX